MGKIIKTQIEEIIKSTTSSVDGLLICPGNCASSRTVKAIVLDFYMSKNVRFTQASNRGDDIMLIKLNFPQWRAMMEEAGGGQIADVGVVG